MCGIVGVTDRTDHAALHSMLELITHRGPDDQGVFLDERTGVALAMRRLSILDIDGGRQPMANEDGSVWVVFNGEIYNSPRLRTDLLAHGHRFRTHNSDTEVLVHLYEDEGPGMVHRLNGMFSFVIYDRQAKTLFAARDRMGIKPFYYAHANGRLAFASELKSLSTLDWVSREIDCDSLYHYLSLQFVPAPKSMLRDVQKLPAGHHLTYELESKSLRIERYWRLSIRPNRSATPQEFVERLRTRLVESVEQQTLSDVPIACSLSGGIDSSAVVGILSQRGTKPVRTYSVGFTGWGSNKQDELPLARRVAERWGTDHHEMVVTAEQLLEDLETMVWHLDEPYAGGLPSWYVYRLIGAECKVVLTGTGGDELFGNYQKWRIYERNAAWRWHRVVRQGIRLGGAAAWRDWQRFPQGHLYHRYLSDAAKDALLFDAHQRPSVTTEALVQDLWNDSQATNPRDAVAAIDFQMQLPEEFLFVTDRFSMAHSVEARVPYLDHELVELAFTVPAELRTKPGDAKYLAKQVVAPFVAGEVLTAPKKGFVLPLEEWTRGQLSTMIADLLSPAAISRQGLLSPRLWQRLVEPHLQGKRNFTQQVWTLLMFQLWDTHVRTVAHPPRRMSATVPNCRSRIPA